MKVRCEHLSKCRLLDNFDEEVCYHSHVHDRKGGCGLGECGFLTDRDPLSEYVCCKPIIKIERKEKIEKILENLD